jgi:hypothetical protein
MLTGTIVSRLEILPVNNLTLFFYVEVAVPGHALLWLSLVKWKRKERESANKENGLKKKGNEK